MIDIVQEIEKVANASTGPIGKDFYEQRVLKAMEQKADLPLTPEGSIALHWCVKTNIDKLYIEITQAKASPNKSHHNHNHNHNHNHKTKPFGIRFVTLRCPEFCHSIKRIWFYCHFGFEFNFPLFNSFLLIKIRFSTKPVPC